MGGGGGGGARSLKGGAQEGEIPTDLAPRGGRHPYGFGPGDSKITRGRGAKSQGHWDELVLE